MVWFEEVTVYGCMESSYLVSYPVSSFRQNGGDGIRAFPSWLKFGVMLHNLSLIIIKYKVSYFKNMWPLDYI